MRRIDQSCRLTSQSREESQRDRTMSGRPRTTSFAESCKPVPQPSAFGSMKVSSKYPTVILLLTYPISARGGPAVDDTSTHDVSPYPVLKTREASVSLAGSLALSCLCHGLRLAPAEGHARAEHAPPHHAPPRSAWRGLAGRVGAGPGRAGPEKVALAPSQVGSQSFLREPRTPCDSSATRGGLGRLPALLRGSHRLRYRAKATRPVRNASFG